MSWEDKYTSKKDFWGNEVLYDENGKEIGKVEKSFFGESIVRDSRGNKVGTMSTDDLARNVLEEDNYSIFTGHHRKTRVDSREPEPWEFNNSGEWDGDEH